MIEFFRRVRSKVAEIFDKIPGLPDIFITKKFAEKVKDEGKLCKNCFPKDGKGGLELPDDFEDIKVQKDIYSYDLKLSNVRPEQFKILGRNLLNMAYEDPMYGQEIDDDTDEEDQLPPPPEPSKEMKSLKYPIISVKATGINCQMVEELGDLFYYSADYLSNAKTGRPEINEPHDDTLPEEVDNFREYKFDPIKAAEEESTVRKVFTNGNFIPGATYTPYQDDDEDWIKLCEQEAPDNDDDCQVVEL